MSANSIHPVNWLWKASLLALLFAVMPVAVNAQSIKERMAAIQRANAELNHVHMVMSIEAFENKKSDKPFYQEKAEIKRDLDNLRSSFSGIEMIKNENCLLMINRSQKQILYTKRSPETEKEYTMPLGMDFDSLIRAQEEPVLIKSEGLVDQFQFKQKNGPIGIIDLFVDSQNQIKRLDYFYNTGQHVVIRFEVFNTKPVFEPSVFDERNFIVKEKGKVRPSAEYANFIVIIN